jgi:hydrogenase-4 component E
MLDLLIVVFIVTLIYLAKVEMVKSYFSLMALQGLLLFGMAYFELREVVLLQLLFILAETLLFKGIFVPLFLRRITRGKVHRHRVSPVKGYYSVLIAGVIVVGSFIASNLMHHEHLQVKYFSAAISAIFVGLFIAINNRDLVTHLIGYLVIENGIFLLSLALGAEMPMFVNSAVLLDVFTSVLVMGVFFNKMKEYFENVDTQQLSRLKD